MDWLRGVRELTDNKKAARTLAADGKFDLGWA
jgi:hypothetical protein